LSLRPGNFAATSPTPLFEYRVLANSFRKSPASTLGRVAADTWKPAQGPLMTRWAGDVTPDKVLPEYPRPQMVRERWENLNGLWDHAVSDKSAETVPTVFSGKILVPFCIESALSGVMKPLKPDQRLWYRRTFSVPKDWAGQRILLHLGAVDWETTVFLNGRNLGSHRGGFDGFSFDITSALKKDGAQELIVSVWDPTDAGWQLRGKQTLHPGGAAYTACSGIWQTVWLEPVPLSSVESLHAAPDLAAGVLKLTVNARTPVGATDVVVTVSDAGKTVATATGTLGSELTQGVRENLAWYKARLIWVTTEIAVPMAEAKPWTPDSPVLYDLNVQLKAADGAVLDTVLSYVSMRTIAVGKDERGIPRPLLNGKPIMLPGALDQGYWPDGLYTAPTDEALRFDIEDAKRLGLVAIRKHLKVEPDRFYYWADRLGLLILQDLPSGKDGDPFTDLPTSPEASSVCEMERRLLIQSRWNHPSIIAWVLFNEGWGQHDTLRHATWAKQLDPTRLINEASGFPRHGGGDIHDTHGGDAPQDGRRICLDTETAGFGLAVPGHSWPGQLWATGTYDPKTDGECASKSCIPSMTRRNVGSRAGCATSIARCGRSGRRPAPVATSRSSFTMSKPKATASSATTAPSGRLTPT
jgi:beta-galactosidase/beta-glucuronidase